MKRFNLVALCLFTFAAIFDCSAAPKIKTVVSNKAGTKSQKIKCKLNSKGTKYVPILNEKTLANLAKKSISKKAAKQGCGALLITGSVSKLSQIPTSAQVINKKAKKNAASSGTPPLLTDIPELDVPELFWNGEDDDNTVRSINNDTADADQCNNFFGGNNDGDDAGLAGCFVAQSVGEIFQNALRTGNSFCYMKNFPTAESGVTIDNGLENIPDQVAENIFDTPASGEGNRLVKVNVTGFPGDEEEGGGDQTIFIEVKSADENSTNKNQYAFDIWFCNDSNQVTGYENFRIGSAGKYTVTSVGDDDFGASFVTISGQLTNNNGELDFDPNSPREITLEFEHEDGGMKADIEIVSDKIRAKQRNEFSDQTLNSYIVAEYTGTSLGELRFTSGAYRDVKVGTEGNNFEAIVEYRSSRYKAAPNASVGNELDDVDLVNDTFYESPDVQVDTSDYDCTGTADVEVTLDFSSEELQDISADCEGDALSEMNFCNNDSEVESAQTNYENACFDGGDEQ
ncbi:MAG: hypothetical protein H6619_03310 [Deltaproteobacteria bacterium]|nr:hypothetical protein [Deltaproteobacteria bacterium]